MNYFNLIFYVLWQLQQTILFLLPKSLTYFIYGRKLQEENVYKIGHYIMNYITLVFCIPWRVLCPTWPLTSSTPPSCPFCQFYKTFFIFVTDAAAK
jgi:hypothetical protein